MISKMDASHVYLVMTLMCATDCEDVVCIIKSSILGVQGFNLSLVQWLGPVANTDLFKHHATHVKLIL